MLDRKYVRSHIDEVRQAVQSKGFSVDLEKYLRLDDEIRTLTRRLEDIQALKNQSSAKIVAAQGSEKASLIASMKKKDEESDEIRHRLQALETEFSLLEREIPNLPRPDVKEGAGADENEIVREVGTKPSFAFQPKDYLSLAEALGLIDMQRAAKVSGARFAYMKGALAQLEFALVQYAFSILIPEGFTPVIPPVLIRGKSMDAMGYLAAHGDEETYHFIRDDLFLVGTSEQSIGPMHMHEVLPLEQLPLRYVAFSTCFRRESGSYGKDMKGIIRVHQFDKIEMFSFTKAGDSDAEHDFLLSMEEKLMQGIGVPYRVVKMVTGDLGVPAARKYDLEAWLPGTGEYRETHSTSTCTDFQARRLDIKYRDDEGKHFAHTLNGTVFAIGRTLAAIIENYQQPDGSIVVPKALQPFVGFSVIKR